MSWILTRPRALAITTLTAALLLTAIPTDAVVATSPLASIASSPTVAAATIFGGPDAATTSPSTSTIETHPVTDRALAAELSDSTSAAATSAAAGRYTAAVQAGSGGHAVLASAQTQSAGVPASSVVVAFARSHLRAHYRHSATGPVSFDCSGLMWRVFKEAGLGTKVTSQSALSIYRSYRARGLASRHDPKVGDLIVWGNGSHIGVYIGGGNAISALTNGVRVHRVRAMLTPFTAYLHTHLTSLVRPAWELQVASHMRTLRHATRTVFLRADASRAGATLGALRPGTKLVVLARRRDGSGRLWLQAMTLTGRTGWIPATAATR